MVFYRKLLRPLFADDLSGILQVYSSEFYSIYHLCRPPKLWSIGDTKIKCYLMRAFHRQYSFALTAILLSRLIRFTMLIFSSFLPRLSTGKLWLVINENWRGGQEMKMLLQLRDANKFLFRLRRRSSSSCQITKVT